MKHFFNIRRVLFFLLFLSFILTAYTLHYKVTYWGFDLKPNKTTDVWIIDAHVSFKASGGPVTVFLSTPKADSEFKILNEDLMAKGYSFEKNEKTGRVKLTAPFRKGKQNLYYRLTVYDNKATQGEKSARENPVVNLPVYDEQQMQAAEEVLTATETMEGNTVQKIISLFNESPLRESVETLLPVKANLQTRAEYIADLLALKNIPTRFVRGVNLVEGKKATKADLMIEAFDGTHWRLFNLRSGKEGLPENFIIFH